jgi:hypothetical protein
MTVSGLSDTVFCFSRPCECPLYTAPRNNYYLPVCGVYRSWYVDCLKTQLPRLLRPQDTFTIELCKAINSFVSKTFVSDTACCYLFNIRMLPKQVSHLNPVLQLQLA